MDSGVKTLSPSKEGPVKRKSPWGTPIQAPAPCSLAAVMDEELAMKLQHEEEHAFKWVEQHMIHFLYTFVMEH